jgi:hypothetical protein
MIEKQDAEYDARSAEQRRKRAQTRSAFPEGFYEWAVEQQREWIEECWREAYAKDPESCDPSPFRSR